MKNKNILNWLYVIVIVIATISLVKYMGNKTSGYETITAKQAYTLMQSDGNVSVLDVRTFGEYDDGHIEGAEIIPVQDLMQNIDNLASVKGKKIIVYCATGNRSESASRILLKNGFTPMNVKGGISAWKSEGYPTTQL